MSVKSSTPDQSSFASPPQLGSGSVSPLPLIHKRRLPGSAGTSPSAQPSAPKTRAMATRSMSHASSGIVPFASVGGLGSSIGGQGGSSISGSVNVGREAGVGGGVRSSMEDMDENSDDAPEVGGENEEVGMASTVANVSGVDIGISEDTGGGGDTVNDDADEDAGTSEDADDGGDMVNEGAEEDAEEDAEEEVVIETYATVGAGSDTDGNEGADAGVESNGSGGDSRGVATCGPLAGDAVTSQHQVNAIPGLRISRLP